MVVCERCSKDLRIDGDELSMHTCTPTEEYAVKKIYEVIADKTLSFGCVVSFEKKARRDKSFTLRALSGNTVRIVETNNSLWFAPIKYKYANTMVSEEDVAEQFEEYEGLKTIVSKIIGHPVMIGDVLDWINENLREDRLIGGEMQRVSSHDVKNIISDVERLFRHGQKLGLRKPIEDQSTECKLFILSLIEKL